MKAQYLGLSFGNHLVQGSGRLRVNEGPFSFSVLIDLEAKFVALLAHDGPLRSIVALSDVLRNLE